MSRLTPEELTVTSFVTTPAAVEPQPVPEPETERLDCWSPLCAPTFWKTCEPCPAAA